MLNKLRGDDRGQMMSNGVVKLVVALAVSALVAAFLIPVAMGVFYGDVNSGTYNTSVGDTQEINAELNATVDSIDTTNDDATITLQTDGSSTTKTVAVGENATYSFDRGDVTVGVEKVGTDASATDYAEYNASYPRDFAYSSGASALWGIIPVLIVLALFILYVGKATDQF